MFPFYVQTRKKDVITDNYVFPLFHLRRGESLSGWQFWPLIGREQKGVTTRTNTWNEVETVGEHDRFRPLAIFLSRLARRRDRQSSKIDVLLPFYSLERSPKRDSSTYLWPILTFTNDCENKYRETDVVGPLVVFARGEGKTMNRVWPFLVVGTTKLWRAAFSFGRVQVQCMNSPPLKREASCSLLLSRCCVAASRSLCSRWSSLMPTYMSAVPRRTGAPCAVCSVASCNACS